MKIIAISVTVLLLFATITNIQATKSVEERAKDLLKRGDTINEALSSFTNEEIENSKFLSKLLEQDEEEKEIDRSYEYEGENEATETEEEREFEEREFIAEIEDDLEDAKDDYKEAKTELQKIETKSEVDRIAKLLEYYKEKYLN